MSMFMRHEKSKLTKLGCSEVMWDILVAKSPSGTYYLCFGCFASGKAEKHEDLHELLNRHQPDLEDR